MQAILLPVLLALFLQPLALLNAHPPAAYHPDGHQICDRSPDHVHDHLEDEYERPAHTHEPTKHLHDPPIGLDASGFSIDAPSHGVWGGMRLQAVARQWPARLFRPPRRA